MSARYVAFGVTLALAWFVAISAIVSALVVAVGRRTALKGSSTFWLSLRLAPALGAAAFVTLLFVPSYWTYEPRDLVEGVPPVLALLALAGLALIAAAIVRGASAWRSVVRLSREWMRRARRLSLDAIGLPVPAYAIEVEQPAIALVGLIRPRLLVTTGLLKALTPSELAATIAHEVGHQHAWDNLKRLAICAAPDLLWRSDIARTIERRWASAAEHGADSRAGRHGRDARCALASALVKVARLTPPARFETQPVSTLIGGGDIASRVRTLLADREPAASSSPHRGWWALALCGTALAAYAPLLRLVHEATETLLGSLP